MSKYIASDNFHIKSEYNDLRKMIIKVMRMIQDIQTSDSPEKHLNRLKKLKDKADKSDVLMDGSIDKLVRKNLITNEMATSLMNDSASVNRLVKNLINISELLFMERDMLLEEEPMDAIELSLEEGILTTEDI